VIQKENLKIREGEGTLGNKGIFQGNSYWLDAELIVPPGGSGGFKIAQKKDKDNITIAETIVGYDAVKHQIFVDRSKAGVGKIREDKLRQTIDLQNAGGTIRLEILFDKSSLEIFVDNGEKVLSTYIYPAEGANNVSAFSVGGDTEIKSLKIWDLSGVNNNLATRK
jgi:levanase/fructan beta-fructosidase